MRILDGFGGSKSKPRPPYFNQWVQNWMLSSWIVTILRWLYQHRLPSSIMAACIKFKFGSRLMICPGIQTTARSRFQWSGLHSRHSITTTCRNRHSSPWKRSTTKTSSTDIGSGTISRAMFKSRLSPRSRHKVSTKECLQKRVIS